MGSLLPHAGEIAVMALVILLIFGFGSLPKLSRKLAARHIEKEEKKAQRLKE